MAHFPKTPCRKTTHNPPKYQLYQWGFNPVNSCWLEGDWVTVTKAEYNKRKATVEKEYARVRKACKTQHHRDKGTALKNMTRMQRVAYEFHSGNQMLEAQIVRKPDPEASGSGPVASPVSVSMAGNAPKQRDITWMRNKGFKIVRWVKHGPQGKPTDQLRGLNFPEDLIIENTKETAFDFVTTIVAQNRRRDQDFFEGNLKMLEKPASELPGGEAMGMNFQQFTASMAIHALIEQEETIIRGEWNKSIGEDDSVIPFEPEKERALYVEMRNKVRVIENWEQWYDEQKKTHNECERANLDNSNGHLYCWVLPKFNDDGTHEPWGERDVPWGHKPKKSKKTETAATAPN